MNENIVIALVMIALLSICYIADAIGKKKGHEGVGCLTFIAIFIPVFCIGQIKSCYDKKHPKEYTEVTLVSSGKTIKIENKDFVDRDTIYIHNRSVYKNDTGKDLIKYVVKYPRDTSKIIVGDVIHNGEYFFWYDKKDNFIDEDDYRMFVKPPEFEEIKRHRYIHSHQRRMQKQISSRHIEFINYLDDKPDYVLSLEEYAERAKNKNK